MFHIPAHKNASAPAAQVPYKAPYAAYKASVLAMAAQRARVYLLSPAEYAKAA